MRGHSGCDSRATLAVAVSVHTLFHRSFIGFVPEQAGELVLAALRASAGDPLGVVSRSAGTLARPHAALSARRKSLRLHTPGLVGFEAQVVAKPPAAAGDGFSRNAAVVCWAEESK